jgi:hypothetical protein
MMNAEEDRQHPIVAERPRGFNGIPEPHELREPDVTTAASHMDNSLRPVMTTDRPSNQHHLGYAEWIAGIAVLGGTIAAIVGTARELTARSRGRASTRYQLSQMTKPHGDKLLPHGQHHW